MVCGAVRLIDPMLLGFSPSALHSIVLCCTELYCTIPLPFLLSLIPLALPLAAFPAHRPVLPPAHPLDPFSDSLPCLHPLNWEVTVHTRFLSGWAHNVRARTRTTTQCLVDSCINQV